MFLVIQSLVIEGGSSGSGSGAGDSKTQLTVNSVSALGDNVIDLDACDPGTLESNGFCVLQLPTLPENYKICSLGWGIDNEFLFIGASQSDDPTYVIDSIMFQYKIDDRTCVRLFEDKTNYSHIKFSCKQDREQVYVSLQYAPRKTRLFHYNPKTGEETNVITLNDCGSVYYNDDGIPKVLIRAKKNAGDTLDFAIRGITKSIKLKSSVVSYDHLHYFPQCSFDANTGKVWLLISSPYEDDDGMEYDPIYPHVESISRGLSEVIFASDASGQIYDLRGVERKKIPAKGSIKKILCDNDDNLLAIISCLDTPQFTFLIDDLSAELLFKRDILMKNLDLVWSNNHPVFYSYTAEGIRYCRKRVCDSMSFAFYNSQAVHIGTVPLLQVIGDDSIHALAVMPQGHLAKYTTSSGDSHEAVHWRYGLEPTLLQSEGIHFVDIGGGPRRHSEFGFDNIPSLFGPNVYFWKLNIPGGTGYGIGHLEAGNGALSPDDGLIHRHIRNFLTAKYRSGEMSREICLTGASNGGLVGLLYLLYQEKNPPRDDEVKVVNFIGTSCPVDLHQDRQTKSEYWREYHVPQHLMSLGIDDPVLVSYYDLISPFSSANMQMLARIAQESVGMTINITTDDAKIQAETLRAFSRQLPVDVFEMSRGGHSMMRLSSRILLLAQMAKICKVGDQHILGHYAQFLDPRHLTEYGITVSTKSQKLAAVVKLQALIRGQQTKKQLATEVSGSGSGPGAGIVAEAGSGSEM